MKKLFISIIVLLIFCAVIFFGGAVLKLFGTLDGPGVIEGKVLPPKVVQDRASRINVVKAELDVLDEMKEIKVCTSYKLNGEKINFPKQTCCEIVCI